MSRSVTTRTKPYKAVAALIVSVAGVIATATVPLPKWLLATATGIVTVGSVFGIENPPRDGGNPSADPTNPGPAD